MTARADAAASTAPAIVGEIFGDSPEVIVCVAGDAALWSVTLDDRNDSGVK